MLSDIVFDRDNFMIVDFFKDYEFYLKTKQKKYNEKKEKEEKQQTQQRGAEDSFSRFRPELVKACFEKMKNPNWRSQAIKANKKADLLTCFLLLAPLVGLEP